MHHRIWRMIAVFAGLLTLFSQHASAQSVTADTLVFAWTLEDPAAAAPSLSPKSLSLAENGTFIIQLDSSARSGTWKVVGDSLYLAYELVELSSPIDSIHYQTAGNAAVVVYYYQGQEIARQTPIGLESERIKEAFSASFDARGNIELRGQAQNWLLTGRAKLVVTPFTFEDVWRGLLGLLFLILILYALSSDRKAIDWKMVGTGMGLQVVFALLVLKVPAVTIVFNYIAKGFALGRV